MPQTKHDLPDVQLLDAAHLPTLAPRSADAHKGQFGHVLLIGGDRGFGGAILLSAQSALRSGPGLVSLATRSGPVPAEIGRQVKPHSCLAFCISSGGLYANRFSLNR